MRAWIVAAVALSSFVASGFSRTSAPTQNTVMHSTVFEWKDGDAKPNAWGAVRQVTRSATPTLDELEIHVSTLNPGQSPHAPHQHEHEELLIVKQGTLETFQNGETRRVGPGGIIFQASNESHNVKNVGDAPAVYYVIGWTPPRRAR